MGRNRRPSSPSSRAPRRPHRLLLPSLPFPSRHSPAAASRLSLPFSSRRSPRSAVSISSSRSNLAAVVPRADLPSPSPVLSSSKPEPPCEPVTATSAAHNRREASRATFVPTAALPRDSPATSSLADR
ncbi:uncharacterized protein LOC116402462 [Cucumis sativus]|uniref:uncharacterized protein LOC116402462 n=1 Tax=Cucumis sativus TaxID=3659 RepID=UPI0012F4BD75|nr:uncharacterized protein LOC116402462 [Cucumis sativus]